MGLFPFFIKAGIYILSFIVTWYAMRCVNYEKILKKGHVAEAQVLYVLIVMGIAWLAGSFILAFFYQS